MAAPNVNGRLHLKGVHQTPPASFLTIMTNLYFLIHNMKIKIDGGQKMNEGVKISKK